MKSSVSRIISIILVCLIIFSTGLCVGINYANRKTDKNEVLTKYKKNTEQSTKIAIVNQDEGIDYNNKYVNYAEYVINSLEENFIVTSRDTAKKGIQSGKYGGMIIFPGDFSKRVITVNDRNPKKAQFYYELNKNLLSDNQYEVTTNILKLEKKLSDNLSYLYVASILNEFNLAQGEVNKVLRNDKEDIDNIYAIDESDLVETINFRELEKLDLDLSKLDFTKIFQENIEIMNEMDNKYKEYVALSEEELKNLKGEIYDSLLSHTGAYSIMANVNQLNILPKYKVNDEYYNDIIDYSSKKTIELVRKEVDNITSDLLENGKKILNEELENKITKIEKYIEGKNDYQRSQENVNENCKEDSKEENEEIVNDEDLLKEVRELKKEITEIKDSLNTIINVTIPLKKYKISTSITGISSESRVEMIKHQREIKDTLNRDIDNFIEKVKTAYENISKYDPLKNVSDNKQTFIELIERYNKNNNEIEKSIDSNEEKNMNFINEFYKKSNEHVQKLEEDMVKIKKASDDKIINGLKNVKEAKSINSAENKRSMDEFSKRLPYTKIGTVDNKNFYDFIASPLKAINTTK